MVYQNLGHLNFPHFLVLSISVKKCVKLEIERIEKCKNFLKFFVLLCSAKFSPFIAILGIMF